MPPTIPTLSPADRLLPPVFCSFTVLLTLYPIVRYLAKQWAFRRDRLFRQLSGKPLELYYNRFRRGAKVAGKSVGDTSLTPDEYAKSFRRDFHSWYGRRYYIAPLVGLTIISIVAGWWACQTIWDMIGNQEIESPHGLVAASMAGAFVWIISDELDRLRRRDFTSSDVYYYVFRILLSIPF